MNDLIIEEDGFNHGKGEIIDDFVTLERWARTNRQKILMNISFESEVHNIYDPKFTSDEGCERSLSSLERSVYCDEYHPVHIE